MKDTEVNKLSQGQRRLLQLGIVLLLGLFLIGYFLFSNRKQIIEPIIKNPTVYIQNSTLYAFDDTPMIMDYTDKLSVHYPYLIFVKTQANTSHVYNLVQKREEKQLKEMLLDYTGTNQLLNQGKTTFFNNQDLGLLCDKGFIKNPVDVLCVTRFSSSKGDVYKVVDINPQTKKQQDIYIAKGIITDVKEIQNKLYIGEIDPATNKSYLVIDKNRVETPNLISLIYEMNAKSYFASFKSVLNKNTESYYLISESEVVRQKGDRIYLFKQ